MTTHIATRELAPAIRDALAALNYRRADIRVEAATDVDGTVAGGSGMRGFVCIVNADTGQRRTVQGSWGGDNPWSRSPVDSGGRIALPASGVAIIGTTGHGGTFARLYAHPDLFGALLPTGEPADALTEAEQQALYCFGAIKGGEYRRDELRRRNVSPGIVDGLVSKGYLKRNKAGAVQITTAGKNVRTVRH